MTVYVSPYNLPNNNYIDILKECVINISGEKAHSLGELTLKDFFHRGSNTVIINWFDDYIFVNGRYSFLRFLGLLGKLALLRLLCKKVIYIKHNYKPHAAVEGSTMLALLQKCIHFTADYSIAHSTGVKDCRYIPHPLYKSDHEVKEVLSSNLTRDIDYLVFGAIDRYKDIDKLLTTWPVEIKLHIYGICKDKELKCKLDRLIRTRELDVLWENAFLSESQLSDLLLRTKFVIVNNKPGSMIVSGVFYHALTHGCNVLLRESDFANYALNKLDKVSSYRLDDIQSSILKTEYRKISFEEINHFSRCAINKEWGKLLND